MKKKVKDKRHFFNKRDLLEEEEFDEEDDDEDDDDEDDEDDDDDEDEEDDEDDDEDEEDDDEEDDDDEIDEETLRRQKRHTRRIRNQIISYLSILLVVAIIGFGGFTVVRHFTTQYSEKKQAAELAAELEELQSQETEVVIAEPEEPAVDPLDEIVDAKIAEMPLEDKIAGLFMVTPEELTGVSGVTKAGDTTKGALEKYKVGGIIYTDDNIKDETQLTELLSNTRLIDQNLLLAVDENGTDGPVTAKLSLDKVGTFDEIGSGGDPAAATAAGTTVGTNLAKYGFNLDFAPVADVKISEDSVLADTSFGTDANTVGLMATAFIHGMMDSGVSTAVKTFPGLGAVTEDTATGMAVVERSSADMEAAEFIAYKAAVDAGTEFFVVGTISTPNLTGDNTPACLSKAAVDILRDTLGFDGVIMTGVLNEVAITDYYTSAEVAVKAIKAGADMIVRPENFTECYEGLLAAVNDGTIEEARIDESLHRIYRVKYKNKVDVAVSEEDMGETETTETTETTEVETE